MKPERRLELARLLSRLERIGPGELLPEIPNSRPIGNAFRIGITGPMGAGKSTLINLLAGKIRDNNFPLGIIAVDPSSPFTGGAVLGDRIRMADHALDEDIFIRSLATKGAFGGLAEGAMEATDLYDMFGFNRIIIETVGVGQTEVDIMEACDATVVVLEPSSGDGVQAIKAGLMEIADLFVVNKMDIKGAAHFVADVEMATMLKDHDNPIKVIPVQATSGDGIEDLYQYLENYFIEKKQNGFLETRRAGQKSKRIKRLAESIVSRRIWDHLPQEEIERISLGEMPVREAAQLIVDKFISLKVL
ncbi:MAG: methylmalonyl Co-A mutase-associated GTPase MeaB [Calditrichaeota bacterium]|jgi:LAO/AO transport system kinase|nr:methylmalonyl Co-A mutase-associated GTPase MeaB [Calditrichota bacterium]MBT7616253.1 methylmalonyl Co-A mutase-associated GTPase MeaB [Calditrichota bacterium]